jgi:hypothetical protein
MKPNLLSASTMVILIALATARGSQITVFEDTFESSNLSQWIGQAGTPHHGQIVADPLNPANHVLTFTTVNSAGDTFSAASIPASTSSRRYILSFDFLALPLVTIPPVEYGGFAGIKTAPGWGLPHYWVAGTYLPALNVPASVATVLSTDGRWHHYEIDFTEIISSNSMLAFQVMLEDWYDRGSIPGDVYFDNVRVLVELVPASLDQLVSAVQESGLPANRKRPLLASLDAVGASLAADDPARLLNQLQAFQNKVQAQVQSSDAALANTLISLAQQIVLEAQSASGIIGQVLIGGCPAQQPGDICHARYQTGITVVTDRGRFITSLTTRPDGSFEIFLPPGDYVLIPDGAGQPTFPMVGIYSVHVDENRFTPVIIEYDNGIR